MALPTSYSNLAPMPAPGVTQTNWWVSFKDPVLDQLIAQGLANNVSIAVAEGRVREAEALARAAGNPLTGDGSVTAQRRNIGSGDNVTGLSLGIDLFGTGSKGQAALARLQAAHYGVQDARLSLLSALAQSYVDLRYFQESIALQQKDLASRRETLSDIDTLLQSGAAIQLDRLRAEALVAETEARIPQLNANAARQRNQIATLLGVPAGSLGINLGYTGRQPVPSKAIAAGVPADLVRRRPDIRQAEQLYEAAVADVGVAVAARYPSLNLTGTIVAPVDSAFSTSQGLSTGLSLPIFNQPTLAAEADAAQARADQAYLQWRGVVLSAVEDVETALAEIAGARLAATSERKVVDLNTEALSQSRKLLASGGDITVLDLLDTERSISEARAALALNRRDHANFVIALYVALGLGPELPQADK